MSEEDEGPKHISECGELDWHELLDRAYLVASMFEQHINDHHVVKLHHELKSRCDDLVDKLWGIYTSIPNYEEQAKWDAEQLAAWTRWCQRDNTHPSVPKDVLTTRGPMPWCEPCQSYHMATAPGCFAEDEPVETRAHEEDCPAVDGFGCRCGENGRDEPNHITQKGNQ